MIDAAARGIAAKGLGKSVANQRLATLIANAERAFRDNVRTRGVISSVPSVTDEGTTLPTGQTNGILRSANTGIYRETGGQWTSSNGRYKSYTISSGSPSYNVARVGTIYEANKVTFRLSATTARWRFIVDGQYVDTVGTLAGSGTGGDRYCSLDFTSAGGRKAREIYVELQQASGFFGSYVGVTERIMKPADPLFRAVTLADSYADGSSATAKGDGLDMVTADYLGLGGHMCSGSGGTGWVANSSGTVYNFLERIQQGDLALNGAPDIITLRGSINDKNSSAAAITANALAGLQAARAAYPNAIILFFGVWPAANGNNGSLSTINNEAALLSAFNSFADPYSVFIPISSAAGQAPLSGTGFVGGATGSGNADLDMFDGSHFNDTGCANMGKWQAAQAISGLRTLYRTLSA